MLPTDFRSSRFNNIMVDPESVVDKRLLANIAGQVIVFWLAFPIPNRTSDSGKNPILQQLGLFI